MSTTSGKKKFSFGKLLLWAVIIFIALQIFTDGEFGEGLADIFEDFGSYETEYEPPRGYLGINIEDKEEIEGGYIVEVLPDSPAADAGLQPGDIIVKVGHATISSFDAFLNELDFYHAGDSVTFTVLRDSERITLNVIFGTRPDDTQATTPSQSETIITTPQDTTTATNPPSTTPPATEPPATEVRLPSVPDELQQHVYLNSRKWKNKPVFSGNIAVTVLFVSDPDGKWADNEIAEIKQQLQDEVARITTDASKYGKSVKLTFQYKTVSTSAKILEGNANDWVESALKSAGFPERSKLERALAKQYGADFAPVMFVANHNGRSNAMPSFGYALLYDDPNAFYHELSHLFGARDFYFPSDVKELAATYLPDSVMVNSGTGTMDDLSAYLVGWTDKLSQNALDFLYATKHVTQEYLNTEKEKESYTGYVTNYTYDGVTYTGYLIRGQLHGEGTRITDRSEWTGTFDHGNFVKGTGTMRYTNGAVYTGQWQNSQRHGKGTMTYADGSRYEGNWKEHDFHGYGIYTYADGGYYEGNWENGKRSGKGKSVSKEGSVWEGTFVDGKLHGQGTCTWVDGSKYVGAFVEGKRHGYGTYYYTSGNRYEGNWANGDRNGQGTMYYSDGAVYTGNWKDNQRHGQGKIVYASGNRYEGSWVNGDRNGQGTYFWANGDRYVGQFKDGKLHGQGTYYYANGSTKTGRWENGNFVG